MASKKWEKKGKPKNGLYIPINPSKVIMVKNNQNKGVIEYRSSWERIFMYWCDITDNVIKWSSEPFAIPYIKPTDFKEHKYYIDFYFECKNNSGGISKYIIEIKPKAEVSIPVAPKRKSEKSLINYQKRIETYQVNQAKWESARRFAKQNGIEFIIITEDELDINYTKK